MTSKKKLWQVSKSLIDFDLLFFSLCTKLSEYINNNSALATMIEVLQHKTANIWFAFKYNTVNTINIC